MKAQKQSGTPVEDIDAIMDLINCIKLFSTENISLTPQFIRITEKFDVVHKPNFKGGF